MQQLVAWAAEKRLSVHVHRAYPLADTAAALESLTGRAVMGKVVVRP